MAKIKYDPILDEMRESDESIKFTGNAGDVFDDTSTSSSKGFTSSKIVSELNSVIKRFGNNGRFRLDPANNHLHYEVLESGVWVSKFEMGGSAYVDVLYFLAGVKPSDTRAGYVSLFGKKNSDIVRPRFADDKGSEFGFVVYDGTNHKLIYRTDDGVLKHIPVVYSDKDNSYDSLDEVQYIGEVNVSKVGNKLIVEVLGSKDTGADIVSKINLALGSTDWQSGGSTPPSQNFRAYAGFNSLASITEDEVKKLPSAIINNPAFTFTGSQSNPPNYFYIVMPQDKLNEIHSVAQDPSILASEWIKGTIEVNGETLGYLRSPHVMYDQTVTFKTIK